MRFLFFNLAVIAALVYLFSADRSGPDIVADHREDALEAIHQELDSLARDVVDGRGSAGQAAPQSAAADMAQDISQAPPAEGVDSTNDVADGRGSAGQAAQQTVATDMVQDVAQEPPAEGVDPAPETPKDRPVPVASNGAETAAAGQDAASAEAQTRRAPDNDPRESSAIAKAIAALPQVDDPAVAKRRAEVLDGVAPPEKSRAVTAVKAGPTISPQERLRKLYSLAEEMELLYVSKMTR